MRKCQVWVFRIFTKTELGFPDIKQTGFKKLLVSSGKNVDIITLLFIQKALAQLTQRTSSNRIIGGHRFTNAEQTLTILSSKGTVFSGGPFLLPTRKSVGRSVLEDCVLLSECSYYSFNVNANICNSSGSFNINWIELIFSSCKSWYVNLSTI